MTMRVLNGAMLLVFALAIAVQWNDPDPAPWMILYGVAAAFTAAGVFGKYTGAVWIAALGFLAGTIYWLPGVDLSDPGSLVTDVRMNSLAVEETREALGLLICAVWMIVLGVVWVRTRKTTGRTASPAPSREPS